MKYENVLERVYEPGRLLLAWQLVKQNAGAAGVEEMSVQEFERRKTELLRIIYKKAQSRYVSFQAGTEGFDTQRGLLKDEEFRYSRSDGQNCRREHPFGVRGDI